MPGKTSTITFRLSEDEKTRLEQIAEREDIPVSQIVRAAIKEYLNQKEVRE